MEKKGWYQSKSVWGSILVIVGLVANSIGYDIGSQEMWVNNILEAVGVAIALYGRLVAVKPIG